MSVYICSETDRIRLGKVAGVFFSAFFYRKTKSPAEKPPFEKIIASYKDLIIEAQEPPKTTPETTIINVTTIKELARTAEILARQMIFTRKPQPTLTIIDQNTLYQHQPQPSEQPAFSA